MIPVRAPPHSPVKPHLPVVSVSPKKAAVSAKQERRVEAATVKPEGQVETTVKPERPVEPTTVKPEKRVESTTVKPEKRVESTTVKPEKRVEPTPVKPEKRVEPTPVKREKGVEPLSPKRSQKRAEATNTKGAKQINLKKQTCITSFFSHKCDCLFNKHALKPSFHDLTCKVPSHASAA